jgi:hypothetical protein
MGELDDTGTRTGTRTGRSKHWFRISNTRQMCAVWSALFGVATVGAARVGDHASLGWMGTGWALLCAATVLPIRVPIFDDMIDQAMQSFDMLGESMLRSLRPRRRHEMILPYSAVRTPIDRLMSVESGWKPGGTVRPPTGDPELDRKLKGLGIYSYPGNQFYLGLRQAGVSAEEAARRLHEARQRLR